MTPALPGKPLPTLSLLLFATACTQYDTTLLEFDSITGYSPTANLAPVPLRDTAQRYPWLLRQIAGTGIDALIRFIADSEPGLVDIENPSGFLREKLSELGQLAPRTLADTGEAVARLLWLRHTHADGFNHIHAMACMTRLLRPLLELDSALREAILYDTDPSREWATDIARLRNPSVMSDPELHQWLRAISTRAAPTASDRLELVRALTALLQEDAADAKRALVSRALTAVIVHGCSHAFRSYLAAESAELREAALIRICEAYGSPALPMALRALSTERPTPLPGMSRRTYDASSNVRRAAMRLASQSCSVHERWRAGPTPIEFLFETLKYDPDPSLRRVAAEAIAVVLGRRIAIDTDWIDSWWREYALNLTRSSL